MYRAALSRDYISFGPGDVHTPESLMAEQKTEAMVVDGNPHLASTSDKIPPATTRSLDAISDNEENLVYIHHPFFFSY